MGKDKAEIIISAEDKASATLMTVSERMKKFGERAADVGKKMAIAGAAVSAGMGLMAKRALDVTNQLWGMKKATDLTAEEVQTFGFAIAQDNADVEKLTAVMGTLALRMKMAGEGNVKMTELFGQFDVQVKNTDGTMKRSIDVFLEMADAMKENGGSTKLLGTTFELLGGNAKQFIPVLKAGSAGIREQMEVKKKLGLLTEGEIQLGKDVGGVMLNLTTIYDHMAVVIGLALLPAISKAAEIGVVFMQVFQKIPASIRNIAVVATALIGVLLLVGGTLTFVIGKAIIFATTLNATVIPSILAVTSAAAILIAKALLVIFVFDMAFRAGAALGLGLAELYLMVNRLVGVFGGAQLPMKGFVEDMRDSWKEAAKAGAVIPLVKKGMQELTGAVTENIEKGAGGLPKITEELENIKDGFDGVKGAAKGMAAEMLGADKLITPLLALGTGIKGVGAIAPIPDANKPGVFQIVIQVAAIDEIESNVRTEIAALRA